MVWSNIKKEDNAFVMVVLINMVRERVAKSL